MKSVVEHGLAHEFPGTRRLFSNLELSLVPGEVVAVVGPSGSGKSTLLSILAGWVKPVEGTVTWSGVESTGWVFQNPHGVPRRTALDHVVLPLLAHGLRRRDAEREAYQIMGRFGLIEVANRAFRSLSGGEAQRLMLARAVGSSYDLLLVDEPTAQLDMATAATVDAVLANIAQDDVIVVVATHDPRTRDACTRVIDLADYQTPGLVSPTDVILTPTDVILTPTDAILAPTDVILTPTDVILTQSGSPSSGSFGGDGDPAFGRTTVAGGGGPALGRMTVVGDRDPALGRMTVVGDRDPALGRMTMDGMARDGARVQ